MLFKYLTVETNCNYEIWPSSYIEVSQDMYKICSYSNLRYYSTDNKLSTLQMCYMMDVKGDS